VKIDAALANLAASSPTINLATLRAAACFNYHHSFEKGWRAQVRQRATHMRQWTLALTNVATGNGNDNVAINAVQCGLSAS
jgi:hypothetical protein